MEQALAINALRDGDSLRVAQALRELNHKLVERKLPNGVASALAEQLETMLERLHAEQYPKRTRPIGEQAESDIEIGFNYGAENSLAYRPISGTCNAMSAPATYFLDTQTREVTARVTFGPAFEGPPGLVHGGFLAAYMDEAFGLCISNSSLEDPAMTGTLNVIYRLPVPINHPLIYRLNVTGEERRKVFMNCSVSDEQGNVFAEGEAIFIKIDPTIYAQMGGQ